MLRAPWYATAVLLALSAPALPQHPGALSDVDIAELASGPYSRMRMLYERTIFGVDVFTLEVRVGEETRRELESLARSGRPSEQLVDEMAEVVLDAGQVLVTLEFARDVSFDRWLQGVRDSLQRARDAGTIDEQAFRRVSENLPEWFRAVSDRGFATGDRIVYRGYPDRMRTLLMSAGEEVLVDQVDQGAEPRRTMLAGYFAPGTDFREPLVESLLAR